MKYVSVCCRSAGGDACITPEIPPMMNIEMKPSEKYSGVLYWSDPPAMVPSQLKIFTPVGMAISIVVRPNMVSAMGPMPVANMWWAQTPKPRKAIKMPEKTIAA